MKFDLKEFWFRAVQEFVESLWRSGRSRGHVLEGLAWLRTVAGSAADDAIESLLSAVESGEYFHSEAARQAPPSTVAHVLGGGKFRALLYACTTAADLGRTVLDEKLPELRRYAAVKEWEVAGEFTDSIPTGVGKRPGFLDLVEAIGAGKGDVVIANSIADLCWDLGTGLLRLQQLGVGSRVWLVCIRNGFDATTPAGALRLLDAMALVAEHRRDRAAYRQQIGILRARGRESGLSMAGRPRVVLSLMELRELWQVQALSQPEILRKLEAAGARVSKGTLARAILNGVEAGSLDPAARAVAMEKRGGLNRGGRKRKAEAA